MATDQQAQEGNELTGVPETLGLGETQVNRSVNAEEQANSCDEKITSTEPPEEGPVKLSSNMENQNGSVYKGGERLVIHPPNSYAPQSQPLYHGGYISPSGQWEPYPHYVNLEFLGLNSPGVYNENQAVMYHSGYGYSPQIPHSPFSPTSTRVPSYSGQGQTYFLQNFPLSGSWHQQNAAHDTTYISSLTTSQVDSKLTFVKQDGFIPEAPNQSSVPFVQGTQVYGSFGRGGAGSFTKRSSVPASHQSGGTGMVGQSAIPLPSGLGNQIQMPIYGFESYGNSYNHSYYGSWEQSGSIGKYVSNPGTNRKRLAAVDRLLKPAKGSAALTSFHGTLDFLNEQSRGPRATRDQKLDTDDSLADVQNEISISSVDLYNSPDFLTDYKDAMFFIIKSYTEDNVHKSIKYGVWTSTESGNKKLDSAYREAKERAPCPVFLLFSVNASGHFCGVAEMTGPVNFEKNVSYWQQDKWSGQFPVKWLLVKDVSNSLFRHIVLENNENKPVTNSRDTQEVKLEQGLEMLRIFKNHQHVTSILDDFDFYEKREKAMLENRATRQQPHQQQSLSGDKAEKPATSSGDIVALISKAFVRAVQMDGNDNMDQMKKSDGSVATPAANAFGTEVAEDVNVTNWDKGM